MRLLVNKALCLYMALGLCFYKTSLKSQVNVDSILLIAKDLSTQPDQASYLDSVLRDIADQRIPGAMELFHYRKQMALQNSSRSDEIKQAVLTAHYLANTFEPEKAKEEILPYYEQVNELEDPLQKADIYFIYAYVHEKLRDNEVAYENLHKAVELYDQVKDSSYVNYHNALTALGRATFTTGRYAESSIVIGKVKELALHNNDSNAVRGALQDLSILFSQIGLYDEAAAYERERMLYYSRPPSNDSRAIGLINASRNLILQDRWREALQTYREALALAPFSSRFDFFDIYIYNGIIECLYFSSQPDSIAFYFNLLENKFDKLNRSASYEFLYLQSRFLYRVSQRQFVQAEKDGLALFNNALQSNDGAEIMMHSRFMSELYRAWNRYDEALAYNDIYVAKKDSIQSANKTNALLLYQTQYETREKENEINSLQQERELLSAKVAKDRLFRALLLTGLVLLLLMGLVVYYRIKQKELLRIQNIRMGISSDLHDEVGSLLSGITMQTDMLAVVPEDEKPGFIREIGENTRRAVTTMRDLVWSIDSRRDKVIDLKDKMTDTCHQLLASAGFKYDLKLSESEGKAISMNPRAKKEIYLIFKEALTNITKHSNGDQVSIEMRTENKELHLSIKDNGKKIKKGSLSGQGSDNMHHRAKLINGQLSINQQPDFYEVVLVAPLK
ncbi:MAG: hypothetical protein HKN76_03610 [Saprospiraceae bacterium]|nr:hypothetical protein [Saprospiraceae bacterium]